MRHIRNLALLAAVVSLAVMTLTSCGKDFQDDIDKLKTTHTSIEGRVSDLESKVTAFNTQLAQLSVLAAAVEQNFYITQVKNTAEGYELTLSNGKVIVLQVTPDNWLVPMPVLSMTQINGFFYWTLNGVLFTDDDGNPIRTTKSAPIVKFDYTFNQWLISIDGGVTFKDINTYASIYINDQVLLQVINSYVSRYSTTIFSQQMLFQIISTYIQQNYATLFNVSILDEVVVNFVNERYTRIFSYELLEKIFTQYDFKYVEENIKVEELINAIISFIQEHQEIFVNNEVLYEIVSNYIEVNKTTVFSEDILLEVINDFISNHQNYINVELLTQVVTNYIDQHRDVVFDTDVVRKMLMEYVKKYYVQVFSQDILIQLINTYVTSNSTTIFNRTLIDEIVSNYVRNNYTTIFSFEIVEKIVNEYIKVHNSTLIDRDVLIDVITKYFSLNYNLFIDRTDITTAINTYIEKHGTTIIDVDIVKSIINAYLEKEYRSIFDYDVLNKIIVNYFETYKEVIVKSINEGNVVVQEVKVTDDYCSVTLSGGQTVGLVVYDALASLSKRVQSVVAVPYNGSNRFKSDVWHKNLSLRYMVTPESMATVIAEKYKNDEITLELIVTDESNQMQNLMVSYCNVTEGNMLLLEAWPQIIVGAVALHIKENKISGTDIMTEFVPVEYEGKQHGYLDCPDDHHPHMIDLGLPSGTLWSCCNVGAHTPYDYGGYYAWGETETKSYYSISNYWHKTYVMYIGGGGDSYYVYNDIGKDIAGTEYDVATTIMGSEWQMPSKEQFQELIDNCTWIKRNYDRSYLEFTGSNGGHIRLPAAGYRINQETRFAGTALFYWASTIILNDIKSHADFFEFVKTPTVGYSFSDWGYRENGLSVRPVASK